MNGGNPCHYYCVQFFLNVSRWTVITVLSSFARHHLRLTPPSRTDVDDATSVHSPGSSRLASKQRCPPGTRGAVPRPTHCAQYYECGATHAQNRLGWEGQLRECPYPYVFSSSEKKCVQPAPGVCGIRQEPLDQCEFLSAGTSNRLGGGGGSWSGGG